MAIESSRAPLNATPNPRRLLRPAMIAPPASSLTRGGEFVPRFDGGLRRTCIDHWRARHPRSAASAWNLALVMAGEYHRDAADRGWTPARFWSVLAGALAEAVDGAGASRTREKYAAMLFDAGLFVAVRAGGRRSGAILRVHLDLESLADGGRRVRERAEARRRQDAARKRHKRIANRRARADTRDVLPPFARTELDQIDDILAQTQGKKAPNFGVFPSGDHVRLKEYADATLMGPTRSPSPKLEKQIPQTPTPAAQGPVDGRPRGKEGREAGRLTFASPEALEDHLYRFVSGRPLTEVERLGSEVGAEVLAALRRAHPQGIQGLKGSLAEDARRACREVARALTPPARTPRARAERFRQKVDRQAAAATEEQVREAAEAILGPVAAANLNPRPLARQGLSPPEVELALGRIQRGLRIGSHGPRALRIPQALPAYSIVTFRRAAAQGPPRGGP